MWRLQGIVLCLFMSAALPVLGDVDISEDLSEATPQEAISEPLDLISSLNLLFDQPLPGEPQRVDGIDAEQLEAVIGRKVNRITVLSSPPGFNPAAEIGIPLGVVLTRSLARRAVLNLWETGKYREIRVSADVEGPDGVVLVLEVAPMFRIGRVDLSGHSALEESEIRRVLNVSPGRPVMPSNEAMVSYRDRLVQEYARRGFPDALVRVWLETTETPGEVVLNVSVREGEPERFSVIRIDGLPDDLREEEVLRRAGFKKGIIRDDVRVQAAIERIGEVLYARGYPDVRVLEDYSFERIGPKRFLLLIRVDAGLRTEVDFYGNTRLRARALAAHLYRNNGFRSSPVGVTEALTRLRRFAVGNGLFHARVSARRQCHVSFRRWYTIDPIHACGIDAKYQRIVFVFQEGPPVEVEDILLSGNIYFSREELREELFAFMADRNRREDMFESFTPGHLDSVTTSSRNDRRHRATRGLFNRPDRVYVPEYYEEVSRHLEDLYREKGFLNVRITDICTISEEPVQTWRKRKWRPLRLDEFMEPGDGGRTPCVFIDDSRTGFLVKFQVEENSQTFVRSIDIRGNDPDVFTRTRLLEEADLAVGQPYNEYRIRMGSADIDEMYKEAGYMFSSVSWSSAVSGDGRAADVLIEVIEGPKVHVNDIVIHSERTKKWFIENNLGFRRGDVVTPSMLARARRRVMALGTLDSTIVQMQSPTTVSERKNIVVTVTDRKPQYMELRAGVATEEGIRGGFEYGHRNMGGLAINSQLRMRANFRHPDIWFFGPEAQTFKADLEERWRVYREDMIARSFLWFEWYVLLGLRTANIPGTRGLLGTGVDVAFENINRRGYSATSVKPYYRLSSNYLRFLPVEIRTGVEGTIVIPSQNPELSSGWYRYSRLPSGQALFFVTTLSISLDFRDNPLHPRSGMFATVRNDYVQSLFTQQQDADVDRKSQYIKSAFTLSGYVPVLGKNNVLSLSGTAGYVFHLASDSIAWADRHFYMGGVSTLRGFAADAVVPQDVFYASQDEPDIDIKRELGGEALFLLRSELNHDFGKNILGAVFAEAGNIWRDTDRYLRNKQGQFAPWILRPVTGLGLRYNTPVGPVSLDVGFNLNKRAYESRWAWYFSFGSAF